jgi:N-acetylated-alpha-linked acidic dipeptidase
LVRWPKEFHPLGTGSDYTVFIHHLGIPSVDMRFTAVSGSGMATSYGVYHSTFDSFSWMEQFGDPTFVFHEKMAVIWGVAALRIADAMILPFEHFDQARLVMKYVEQVEPMVTDARVFEEMQFAARKLIYASIQIHKERMSKHNFWDLAVDSHLNDRIAFAEKRFLHQEGLPLRKWFKHVLQAPDLYLGYSAVVLPGIMQAFLDQRDPVLANQQARVVAHRLRSVADFLLGKDHIFNERRPVEEGTALVA